MVGMLHAAPLCPIAKLLARLAIRRASFGHFPFAMEVMKYPQKVSPAAVVSTTETGYFLVQHFVSLTPVGTLFTHSQDYGDRGVFPA